MYKAADTLDDLLIEVFTELTNVPFDVSSTRGHFEGNSSETIGAMLLLTNPRARLSRTETKGTVFSALGELLWYLSKSNALDFIKYYIKDYEKESVDGISIHGGYGPRLFSAQGQYDQVHNVIKLLRERSSSRRAAIQLFDAKDISENFIEIPCTCTLQFILRQGKLHMITFMRSNDAYKGLPHDFFAFTMIQEIIARTLGVELGFYHHSVGSLHLYESAKDAAFNYIKEGFQPTKKNMPAMPIGDPWPAINTLLEVESKFRHEEKVNIAALNLDPYWLDLVRLLQIHALFKKPDYETIVSSLKQFYSPIYNTFIEKRMLLSRQRLGYLK